MQRPSALTSAVRGALTERNPSRCATVRSGGGPAATSHVPATPAATTTDERTITATFSRCPLEGFARDAAPGHDRPRRFVHCEIGEPPDAAAPEA